MSFEQALAAAKARARDPNVLERLASAALAEGEEERALPILQGAAEPSARLLQWRALLERALDRHEEALRSFESAAALAPNDQGIAHGLARTALEAGIPAEGYYERALQLSPGDGQVLLGFMAARVASGRGEIAEAELSRIVERTPGWTEGQMQLAQLRSTLGRTDVASSLRNATAAAPGNTALWSALFDLHIKRDAFDDLDSALSKARSQGIADDVLNPYAAIAAGELGRADEADRLFGRWKDGTAAIWHIRHLLRTDRARDAIPLIDGELAGARANEAWPYASIAWRLTQDSRFDWLQGDDRLVQVFDLSAALPPLDRLAETLRTIHVAKGTYLDQSVRGGTQTDGPLFSRVEPEIRALRAAVVDAVEAYGAGLPPIARGHPLLGRRRDRPIRFAGSWSVRLRDAGHHVSHVHPQGWISSALYVALPQSGGAPDPHSGWLRLGEPPRGLPTLEPRYVEPKPGRLVLFPSWMWHGTVPFDHGERLTVAFDVAPRGPAN